MAATAPDSTAAHQAAKAPSQQEGAAAAAASPNGEDKQPTATQSSQPVQEDALAPHGASTANGQQAATNAGAKTSGTS